MSETVPKGAQTPYINDLNMRPNERTFGRWRISISQGKLGPVAKFYDLAQDPVRFPGGQHVSDYYVSTLLGTDGYSEDVRFYPALSLYGSCEDWTVYQPDLTDIADWLEDFTEGSL